jgi:molybdopterin synthase sulfur carrier subunit
MKIKVLYFASLQEYANQNEEVLELADNECKNAKELYGYLKNKYNFDLCEDDLKVAINEQYANFDTELKNDDIIAFIPPIAGG